MKSQRSNVKCQMNTDLLGRVNGKTIEYVILNPLKQENKTPLFIVHGWGGSSQSLKPLGDFCSTNYTTVLLDLPGFGKSDLPEPEWGIWEYTDFLVQFISQLGYKQINYFGHSFGGALGISLAYKYPQLIENLIVCAPSYKRDSSKSPEQPTKGIKNFITEKLPIIRRVYYKLFYPNSDIFVAPKLEPNFKKIITQDLSSILPKIKTRTLVIGAELDKSVPTANIKFLHESLTNSEVKIYENIGHALPKLQPENIYSDITNFIQKNNVN